MQDDKTLSGFHEKDHRFSLAWVLGWCVFAVTLILKLALDAHTACAAGGPFPDCAWTGFTIVGSDVLTALLEGAVTICFLELIIRKSESRAISEHITKTLEFLLGGGNKAVFAALAPKTKEAMVRSSLESTLGGEYGTVFYDQIVASYMGRQINFRSHFHYHITCHDSLPLNHDALDEAERKFLAEVSHEHIWVEQDLAYRLHSAKPAEPMPYLYARFAFSHHQLTRFIGLDGLFFRELFRVPDAARNILFGYDDGELLFFLTEILGLSITDVLSGDALPYTVRWGQEDNQSDASKGRYIEIKIANPSGLVEGAGCRLKFALPHQRSDTAFLVTLPQPIKPDAEISFTKCASMDSLSYVPFLSRFRDDTYIETMDPPGDPARIAVSIRHWAFPTGGMMFLWKSN